ncbi:MAG TPA: hypothetical protein VGQ60_01790 [Nitrospiraceae bacterium]|jgi:hypothetical protein|nr:hypothetical protein [Nitrospiraceae bacterium]
MRTSRLATTLVNGALSLCFLSGLLAGSPALAVRISNEPNGFNEYTWGSPLASFPALQQLRELGKAAGGERISVYEKPDEVLTLNGVTLNRIRYRFVDGQLASVGLSYEGRENRDKLLQWIEEHYGKVTPAERRMFSQVEWIGEKTEVTLSYYNSRKEGTLLFISSVIRYRLFDSNMGGGGMP